MFRRDFDQQLQHAVVFVGAANRGAQAVLEVQLVATVADHNTAVGHFLVDSVGVGDLKENEVGVRRIDALHEREAAQLLQDTDFFLLDDIDLSAQLVQVVQCLVGDLHDAQGTLSNTFSSRYVMAQLLTLAVSLLMLYGALTLFKI